MSAASRSSDLRRPNGSVRDKVLAAQRKNPFATYMELAADKGRLAAGAMHRIRVQRTDGKKSNSSNGSQ